jgi:beta-1,2-mannobiose phosphorylase / 1,2-beta-oligomannan phosphorylase
VIVQQESPSGLAAELFVRHPDNPILTARDWPYRVNAIFNPAAALVDGETVLLARVEDRTGISHLTVARSSNGVDAWTVDPEPLLAPHGADETEVWGFEDARAVWIDELERFAITCTAYGPAGPAVFLATTTDFSSVERHGIIKRAEDKNAALLPERVDGKWILFHRPMNAFGGSRGAIFLSRSVDLVSWSLPEPVLQPRHGAWWDSLRIGIGPPLVKTDHGWLLIYHGVKETVAGCIYRIGLAMLDLNEPTRVLRRHPGWVFGPAAGYEREGDVPNTVFPCGLVHDEALDTVHLYYGAADTSICLATTHLRDLVGAVMAAPAYDCTATE